MLKETVDGYYDYTGKNIALRMEDNGHGYWFIHRSIIRASSDKYIIKSEDALQARIELFEKVKDCLEGAIIEVEDFLNKLEVEKASK